MNAFYDISTKEELQEETFQLRNLGSRQIFMSVGKSTRGDWGERGQSQTSHYYTSVTAEDYDHQFVSKLTRTKPSYKIDGLIDHHLHSYLTKHPEGKEEFLMHMRYEILPLIKKGNNEVFIELFEKWLNNQTMMPEEQKQAQTINNNINIGHTSAPFQIQQNSHHAVQTQNNQTQNDQLSEFFEILRNDIQHIDENIRKDFAIEMEYAVSQLKRNKDVKPQLLSIGGLMKDVGIGTFTNLLAAPIFEIVKPFLGLG